MHFISSLLRHSCHNHEGMGGSLLGTSGFRHLIVFCGSYLRAVCGSVWYWGECVCVCDGGGEGEGGDVHWPLQA